MAHVPLARPTTAPTARRRWVSEEAKAGWLTVTPWLIGFAIFTAFPLLASIYFSFTKYDVLTPPQWVGLENYQRLFTRDRLFPIALQNTLTYALMVVPLDVATALGAALLLNRARRWQGFFRTVYYLPAITPVVATSYLFLWVMNPNDGVVNTVLRAVGLPAPAWTVDPFWMKPTIVISKLWILGSSMVILLAALKQVPASLYEAALLDGAGRWRRFRDVTLPMISGVLFFVATVGTINALQVFAEGMVMFDEDGGPRNAALFVNMYLFKRAFGSGTFQMGYAAAIAWILFLIVVTVTILQFKLSKRWVYYESGNE